MVGSLLGLAPAGGSGGGGSGGGGGGDDKFGDKFDPYKGVKASQQAQLSGLNTGYGNGETYGSDAPVTSNSDSSSNNNSGTNGMLPFQRNEQAQRQVDAGGASMNTVTGKGYWKRGIFYRMG